MTVELRKRFKKVLSSSVFWVPNLQLILIRTMQLTDREYGLQGVHWYCDIFHTLLHQNVSKKTPQKLELVLFPKKVRKKVALCRNYPKV